MYVIIEVIEITLAFGKGYCISSWRGDFMTKKTKKSKKQKKTLKTQMKFELIGLLFIAIAIFGSGAALISDGLIPSSLEHILRFFFGVWYFAASIFLFILGCYLMIKRTYPNFIHRKFIGLYITFLGLILLTHIQTFEDLLILPNGEKISIIRATWENYISYVRGNGTGSQTGGGIMGAILFTMFGYLFSTIGAKMIALLFMIIGVIFLTDISVGELLNKTYSKIKTQCIAFYTKIINRRKEKKRIDDATTPGKEAEQPTKESEKQVEEQSSIVQSAIHEPLQIHDSQEVRLKKDEVLSEGDDTQVEETPGLSSEDEEENERYEIPSFDLLTEPVANNQQNERSQIQKTARKLEETFTSFGVKAKVTKVHIGPAVTKYEVYPDAGVKVSRIVNLHDDLALALAAKDIRIEAPIPGKSAVGIEVPNQDVAMVSLVEVLRAKQTNPSKLLFALGRDISGEAIADELSKMPHLLIAGATGSGKSVCINGIIVTILMRAKPHEVKMMMIDPKKVELNMYNGIPHLLAPVVTDPRKAAQALKKVVAEMERRYELFSEAGSRNIESYNEHVRKHNEDAEIKQPILPYIVVIVDELADLMMVASSDVEDAIARLAQMARAAGIHLIIATQRPSVDVITGVIKANIPSRIAFSVSSQIDSRTILDSGGAEKLLGRGDMLYMPVGSSKPTRVQGAFLTDEEVEAVVNHCINQQKAVYEETMIPDEVSETPKDVDDELYSEAIQIILEAQSASVSMLQRRLRIGYNRAARLIDSMEDQGIVGPHEGSKPRTVLITNDTMEEDESPPS